MSEPRPDPSSSVPPSPLSTRADAALFATPAQDRERSSLTPWIVAGGVVLVLLVGILLATHHATPIPKGPQPPDSYAVSLPIDRIQMSESASLSAVKVTYIDGHIRNTGSKTVKNATVQVLFANDEQLPPQVETLPLTLVRTHEPYIDTEPVSANPIRPGDDREFRLIFENIGENWNQQLPQIRMIKVD